MCIRDRFSSVVWHGSNARVPDKLALFSAWGQRSHAVSVRHDGALLYTASQVLRASTKEEKVAVDSQGEEAFQRGVGQVRTQVVKGNL